MEEGINAYEVTRVMPKLKVRLVLDPEELGHLATLGPVEWPGGGALACSWGIDDNLMVSCDVREILAHGEDLEYILGVLTHEAVHVAMNQMRLITEDEWGEEEIAYHVDAAATALFRQFFKWLEMQ